MSRFLIAACACVACAIACPWPCRGPSARFAIGIASDWVELQTLRACASLPGPAGRKSRPNRYLAGVEIALADGWKTYWRKPGDAGVPPAFDWAGSTNVATIEGALSRAARGCRSRPPRPSATRAPCCSRSRSCRRTRPSRSSLEADAGVRHLPRDLHPGAGDGQPSLPAEGARGQAAVGDPRRAGARAPPAGERRRDDPELQAARRASTAPSRSSVRGSLSARRHGRRPLHRGARRDLSCRCPSGSRMRPTARPRFEVDLSRGDNARDLKGKTLTLTLVSEDGASEAFRAVE